jgi:hypothetical protein
MSSTKPRLKKDRRTQKEANQRRAIIRIEYDDCRRGRERRERGREDGEKRK